MLSFCCLTNLELATLKKILKAFRNVLLILVIIVTVSFLSFNFYHSQTSQVMIYAEGEFVEPDSFPGVEVTYYGDATPGRLTFALNKLRDDWDFVNPDTWEYLVEYDTEIQQVVYAERAWYSATNLTRHSRDTLSYYHYPFWEHHFLNFFNFYEAGLQGVNGGNFVILDENYEEVRRFGEIWNTDLHELNILDNGNIVYTGAAIHEVEPEDFPGNCSKNCMILTQPVVEIDPDDNIVREFDPFELYDSASSPAYSLGTFRSFSLRQMEIADTLHLNSISSAPDGDYILSFRNYSDVIKVDPDTHEIDWHMGGRGNIYNEFEFIDDPLGGFTLQHRPLILENGNLLVYDNGNHHEPPVTRILEYELDTDAMTATLVWSYITPEESFSPFAGNALPLDNGNMLISYALQDPAIIEINPDGEVVMEISFPPGYFTYRVGYYPWYDEVE